MKRTRGMLGRKRENGGGSRERKRGMRVEKRTC